MKCASYRRHNSRNPVSPPSAWLSALDMMLSGLLIVSFVRALKLVRVMMGALSGVVYLLYAR